VAGDGDIRAIITIENFVERRLTPDILIDLHLPLERFPQEIILRESSFDVVAWECIVDISPGSSPVTSVAADALTEELLDCWDEWPTGRKIETGECDVGGLQAAG
jgi:hypothetical protein